MIDAIMGVIGLILYPLFSLVFVLLDGISSMFRGMAGIGEIQYQQGIITQIPITSENTGQEHDSGILYYLLQHDIIKNMIISIAILGLFLLIVFTVMAFIKNAYAAKPKTWQEIVGNAFKGLANFVFVPICCILGVWVGNILLKAIDGATSTNNSQSMAGKLFICAAYNANEIRRYYVMEEENNGEYTTPSLDDQGYKDKIDYLEDDIEKANKNGYKIEFDKTLALKDASYAADKVDELYASGANGIYFQWQVSGWYTLYEINYLVIIVGGLFMSYVLIAVTYAMIRRLFLILMLFVISPGLCAMYPLDDGKAVGSWKSEFIKLVLSAYGAVAGMNLFFSIMPVIQNIRFGGAGSLFDVLGFTELILLISGLFIVKEFISMISNFVGGEDAYSKGSSLRNSVKGVSKKFKEKTGAFAKKIGGAVNKAHYYREQRRAGASTRNILGNMLGDVKDSALKNLLGIDGKDLADSFRKAGEEGRNRAEKDIQLEALNELLTRMRLDSSNANYINREDAFKKAKDLGIEELLAEKVAQQQNAQMIRAARESGSMTDLKLTSGKALLEEIKASKEFNDGVKQFNDAVKLMSDKFTELYSYSSLEIDPAEVLRRAMSMDAFTDIEITNARDEDQRDAMREFNALMAGYQKAESSMESIAAGLESKGMAVAKFNNPDLINNQIKTDFANPAQARATVKKIIEDATTGAKTLGGSVPAPIYDTETAALKSGIEALGNRMADSIERVANEIKNSNGGKKGSK